jgi:hypothetical protein
LHPENLAQNLTIASVAMATVHTGINTESISEYLYVLSVRWLRHLPDKEGSSEYIE